jgi:gluconate kinase
MSLARKTSVPISVSRKQHFQFLEYADQQHAKPRIDKANTEEPLTVDNKIWQRVNHRHNPVMNFYPDFPLF